MKRSRLGTSRGMSLPELILALVIVAIVGVGLTKLLLSQNRFFGHQNASRDARMVSRGAINLLMSDLRMIDASGAAGDTIGVVSATSSKIVVRVPYALGILCNTSVANLTLSLVPLDTVLFTQAGFSGFAWRDTVLGKYHYMETGVSNVASTAANCAAGFTHANRGTGQDCRAGAAVTGRNGRCGVTGRSGVSLPAADL